MTVQILDDGRSDGTALQGPKLTFFAGTSGGTPVVQPSGNALAAIARGSGAGVIMGFSATNSPSSVATLTTVSASITLVGGTGAPVTIASGDVLFVNKPTSQAGLGIGNVLVGSAGVAAVTFSNFVSGFLTPTASQVYSFIAIRGLTSTTAALTPAAVAPATTAEQIFSVPGVRVGELLQVMKPTVQAGIDIVGIRVVGNNSVGITFGNVTSGTVITPTAAQTYTFISLGGVDAQSNDVVYQVSVSPAAVGALSTVNNGLTITNLALGDIVTSVSKPTQQNGLLVGGGGFVSAAGSAGFTLANVTSAGSLTPTANEVYAVRTWRPNLAGPMALYTPTLSPTSIAANTTAEQGFTVTGLVTNSMVWVNKPTTQNGIGIVGVRVSAFNTLGITFANFTSGTLTPAQGEVYTVGNFQMPVEATGNSWIMTAQAVEQQSAAQGQAIRNGLVALNLLGGS